MLRFKGRAPAIGKGSSGRPRDVIVNALVSSGSVDPGTAIEKCVVRLVRRQDYSEVYYIDHPELEHPIAGKIFKDGRGSPDVHAARRQFGALQSVAAMRAICERYTVPQPIGLAANEGIVFLEWIEGVSAAAKLVGWKTRVAETTGIVRDAGKWLRAFHALRPECMEPLDVTEQLESAIGCIPAEPGGEAYREAASLLERSAGMVQGAVVERSWLHGDFKAENVMLSDRAVVGLDVHLRHCNARLYDVASFLNHLDLLLWHPRAVRARWSAARLRRMFLESYGASDRESELLVLSWLRLRSLMVLWHMVMRSEKHVAVRWYLRAGIERCMAGVMRELRLGGRG